MKNIALFLFSLAILVIGARLSLEVDKAKYSDFKHLKRPYGVENLMNITVTIPDTSSLELVAVQSYSEIPFFEDSTYSLIIVLNAKNEILLGNFGDVLLTSFGTQRLLKKRNREVNVTVKSLALSLEKPDSEWLFIPDFTNYAPAGYIKF